MRPRIVIVGAGIGGLCLARALTRAGREVVVLERGTDLSSDSAGVVVHGQTIAKLREIGLDRDVLAAGQVLQVARMLTARGAVLASKSAEIVEREFGSPSVAIHGTRLRQVLAAELEGVVELGVRVATYEETAESITVSSDDGRQFTGTVLVGADGMWSRIRSRLVGDGPPQYAGYTSWRGVADACDLVEPGTSTETWGRGERFGIVSLAGGQAYWFALANARAGGHDAADPIDHLRGRFGGWHEPIDVLLRRTAAEDVRRVDIHDRAPIRRWGDGRVVLLGDAAHPMTPNLAHGAGQAIEDAVALSHALVRHDAVIAAFREYEARRVDRANQLLRWSRSYGEIAQWNRPVASWLRDAALRLTPGLFSPIVMFGA
jgi:2-polyprenyl-6-methoxyphenol hydroxylase-like FAD-dependent oxidoreductase